MTLRSIRLSIIILKLVKYFFYYLFKFLDCVITTFAASIRSGVICRVGKSRATLQKGRENLNKPDAESCRFV